MSINYGLAGGILDATEHIKAAEKRLCYPSEISAREKFEQRMESVRVSTTDQANAARQN